MFPLTSTMRNHWILLLIWLFAFFAASHGSCTAPPISTFGAVRDVFLGKDDFSINSIVTYTCRPGFIRSPGIRNTITCLSDSTWSTPGEFCKRRSCGNPGEPDNGEMHGDDFLFGSRVNYTCNTGYNMESRRDYRECLADGTWSNAVSVCGVQECYPPNAITDGSFNPDKTDYVYQDAVTYTCKSGLSLIGEASIFCTSHGDWSSDPPQCKVIDCINPEIPNAEKLSGFTGPYTLNSAVRFQCSKHFTMIGSGHVTCNVNNMWDPPLPTCNRTCTAPPRLTFGELRVEFIDKNYFFVNSTVTYNCRSGYVRDPVISNTITCLSDSTWSIPGEFCKRRSCGNPGKPNNGKMHFDDFLFGSRVKYTCNTGYNMESRRDYRECLADGTWSNAVPVCSVQECPPPNAITDGSFKPDKTDYVYQDAVTYTCKSGLSLIGEASIFCTSHGYWSTYPPQCKVIDCINPEVLNAKKLFGFPGPYTLNSAVSFQCYKDFTMIGSGHVTCNASSMWDPTLPTCNRSCTAPPRLIFGQLTNEFIDKKYFFVNSTVTYTCQPGYVRDSAINNTITCLSDSTWSIPGEFCKRRSCGKPREPDHGQMHGDDFLFGARVNYTCHTGYNMESKKDYRVCLADGIWSNAVPVCIVQECPSPIAITDGSFNPDKTDYVYQDAVTYTCKSGLSLIGEASIFCTSHGNWSSHAPQCKGEVC